MASLYKRPNRTQWWAKFSQNGKIVRVSTGTASKRRARDFLDVHAGKVAAGEPLPVKLDRITFDELRADLSAHYQATGALRHPDDAERRLRHLDAAFRAGPPSTSRRAPSRPTWSRARARLCRSGATGNSRPALAPWPPRRSTENWRC